MSHTAELIAVGTELLLGNMPGSMGEVAALALLCGFVCGWPWGLAVGFISPLLRSVLFGMPDMFPTAVAMAFELAAYGLFSGLLYQLLPKKRSNIYVSLILAMLGGRIVWGIAMTIISGVTGSEFGWAAFIAGAFTSAVPGIIVHIILIPVLVMSLQKAGFLKTEPCAA